MVPTAPSVFGGIVARLFMLVAALAVGIGAQAAGDELRLVSVTGEAVDPLASPPGTKAIALLFVSVDCPISNRYAPELRRLHDRFSSRGVVFRLIYPNPAESASSIRRHLEEYGYRVQALRDPRHELVKATQVAVTPEAAVYDGSRRLLYRGRIDDRYLSPGLERAQPTRRELEGALLAALSGRRAEPAAAPAVGCFIADLAE
jgi:hypothetical protein